MLRCVFLVTIYINGVKVQEKHLELEIEAFGKSFHKLLVTQICLLDWGTVGNALKEFWKTRRVLDSLGGISIQDGLFYSKNAEGKWCDSNIGDRELVTQKVGTRRRLLPQKLVELNDFTCC